MKHKLLFFNHRIGGGGSERVTTILANLLCSKYDVTIAMFEESNSNYNIDSAVKVVKLPREDLILNFKEYIISNNIDVVIDNYFWASFEMPLIEKHIIPNTKYIKNDHSNFLYHLYSREFNIYTSRCSFYRKCDHVIAMTSYNKKLFELNNVLKSTLIPNPCTFIPDQKSTLDNYNMVAIGRFNSPEKNFLGLLKFFEEVVLHDDRILLNVVGSTPSDLGDILNEFNIPKSRIIFHGEIKDVSKILLNSSLLVVPSLIEYFPMVILEAYACSVPVLSYKISGFDDFVIDHETGMLITQGDYKGLARQATELFSNNNELIKEFGVNSFNFVNKHFTQDIIRDKWIAVIEKVFNNETINNKHVFTDIEIDLNEELNKQIKLNIQANEEIRSLKHDIWFRQEHILFCLKEYIKVNHKLLHSLLKYPFKASRLCYKLIKKLKGNKNNV